MERLAALRTKLAEAGWRTELSDPLRLTVSAPQGIAGWDLAARLRRSGVECEYADPDFLVLMATPENAPEDGARLLQALGTSWAPAADHPPLPLARGERVCSIRQAMFSSREIVPAAEALGRICGAPIVGCPPAVPVAVSGERITPEALALFIYYGMNTVEVLEEKPPV